MVDPYQAGGVCCDKCWESVPAAQVVLHCEQCNYDLCPGCAAKTAAEVMGGVVGWGGRMSRVFVRGFCR